MTGVCTVKKQESINPDNPYVENLVNIRAGREVCQPIKNNLDDKGNYTTAKSGVLTCGQAASYELYHE